jgi:hypothetical protein
MLHKFTQLPVPYLKSGHGRTLSDSFHPIKQSYEKCLSMNTQLDASMLPRSPRVYGAKIGTRDTAAGVLRLLAPLSQLEGSSANAHSRA